MEGDTGRPPSPDDDDRRASRRLPASAVPNLKARLLSGPDVRLVDVSRRGVLLETNTRLMPDSVVRMKFVADDGTLVLKGVVARSNVSALGDHGLIYRTAVTFEEEISLCRDVLWAEHDGDDDPTPPAPVPPGDKGEEDEGAVEFDGFSADDLELALDDPSLLDEPLATPAPVALTNGDELLAVEELFDLQDFLSVETLSAEAPGGDDLSVPDALFAAVDLPDPADPLEGGDDLLASVDDLVPFDDPVAGDALAAAPESTAGGALTLDFPQPDAAEPPFDDTVIELIDTCDPARARLAVNDW